ncbi:MAG: antitoxin [Oscillospiraceae bacterium]|nr:antitoxin [Oscillospiraceae bacterium]
MKNNYDEIKIRVYKGKKSELQAAAEKQGDSLNAYIKKAVREQYKKDTGNDIEL